MDVNLVVLSGRLAAPPEIRSFESGAQVLRYLILLRSEAPRRVDVVPVTLWNPDPDHLTDDPAPGTRIRVSAEVQRRYWEGPDGRRSRIEIVADRLTLGADVEEDEM